MSSDSIHSVANVDGSITPASQARVPVLDRGFLYGDSVYEVFRTYSGVPLFYDEHYSRLLNSANLIHMRITQTREEITDEIRRTVQASGAKPGGDVYVRYTITRGEGPVDLYPTPDLSTRFVVIVKEIPPWNPDFYRRGMRLAVPTTRRNPVNALDPNIKGGNYLNNILALSEARELGADDCVILNQQNMVSEASNSNLFFVIDGELITPGSAAGNLRGITRNAVQCACAGHGLSVSETDVHADDLSRATECFVTSATREVMPVLSLRLEDATMMAFPEGGGELTRRVAEYYRDYLDRYVAEHAHLKFF
jgi:branched-chain amino acid aminotransferase